MKTKLIIIHFITLLFFSKISLADGVMSPEYAFKHLATMTVLGEICESNYPELKQNIQASWIEGWDEPTQLWATNIRKSPDFLIAVELAREEMLQKETEFIKQCLPMYGPNSYLEKSRKDKAEWDAKKNKNQQ
jgi:hypothetical protein